MTAMTTAATTAMANCLPRLTDELPIGSIDDTCLGLRGNEIKTFHRRISRPKKSPDFPGNTRNHFVAHLRKDRQRQNPRLVGVCHRKISRLVSEIRVSGIKRQGF